MNGDIFQDTLNITMANVFRFLMCIKTVLSFSKKSSKDDI